MSIHVDLAFSGLTYARVGHICILWGGRGVHYDVDRTKLTAAAEIKLLDRAYSLPAQALVNTYIKQT